jgi:hypothetical protein
MRASVGSMKPGVSDCRAQHSICLSALSWCIGIPAVNVALLCIIERSRWFKNFGEHLARYQQLETAPRIPLPYPGIRFSFPHEYISHDILQSRVLSLRRSDAAGSSCSGWTKRQFLAEHGNRINQSIYKAINVCRGIIDVDRSSGTPSDAKSVPVERLRAMVSCTNRDPI